MTLMRRRIGTVWAVVGLILAVSESASAQSHSNTNCQRFGNSINCSTTTQPYVLPGPQWNPAAEAMQQAYERARAESEARRQRQHELEMQERQQAHERQMRDHAQQGQASPGQSIFRARAEGGFITVTSVRPGSSADWAGLRPGHRIIRVAGQNVDPATPQDDFRSLLKVPPESASVEVVVLSQDGRQLTLWFGREPSTRK